MQIDNKKAAPKGGKDVVIWGTDNNTPFIMIADESITYGDIEEAVKRIRCERGASFAGE